MIQYIEHILGPKIKFDHFWRDCSYIYCVGLRKRSSSYAKQQLLNKCFLAAFCLSLKYSAMIRGHLSILSSNDNSALGKTRLFYI